ncbi:MAG: redoxin domain-containing protein [Rickettsiales bacterium]|nr:redoxin domain-containing protein [Rickettsiales bacterium]
MGRSANRQELARDWAFILNASGLALIVAAIIVTFAPYVEFNNPNLEEIKAVERSVERVIPKNVPARLLKAEKPVMLVFYASWCSYCAKLMPKVLQMIDDHELDMVKPVFLSMDSQPRVFAKYLVKTKYYKRFPPLMLQEVFYNNLPEVMAGAGSHFNGAIPYIGFFSTDGKMVAEIFGLVDKQGLLEAARKVQ